jgi:N-acetylglucosaminyl-diphospho-decaprenol L-rhamnosyltransferase
MAPDERRPRDASHQSSSTMTSPVIETAPLAVIIVSYKCLDVLRECLDSLYAEGESLCIVVVDNASHDGTVEAVRAEYPDVVLIANSQNAGFPGANNQGIRLVQSRNILLLNPDTVVVKGALRALIEFLDSDTQLKIVGPTVLNFDGSLQHTVHATIPGPFRFFVEQIGLVETVGRETAQSKTDARAELVGWVSGAALAFNRDVIRLIGELDEAMFWAEDLDFCYRAHRAGIPVYHLLTSRIMHHMGKSGKKNYRRMIFARHSSRVEYAKKHYGKPTEIGLRTAFGLLLPIKMAIRVVQLSMRDGRTENKQRLAGYWDALTICLPRIRRTASNQRIKSP